MNTGALSIKGAMTVSAAHASQARYLAHTPVSAGPFTISADYDVYECTNTITGTLPAATGSGKTFYMKNAGTGVLTVCPATMETIGGSLLPVTVLTGDCLALCDTAVGNWRTVAEKKTVYGLAERVYVGASGRYATLKAAVDYFNASATSDMEILLDAGHHLIADTVTVYNATYSLQIRGLGSAVTFLDAATGLTGKPMFIIRSDCDINKVTATGSTLASYGTATSENFIDYTDTGVYSEVTDIFIDTFKIGLYDSAGIGIFLFNFGVISCGAGVKVNHPRSGSIDVEVGNFELCPVGIDLVTAALTEDIYISAVYFINASAGVGVAYAGAAVVYGRFAIVNCNWNEVGSFWTGFDFERTDARDGNIVLRYNVGEEDKTPHAKINVVDNAIATSHGNAGVYGRVAGINSKFGIVFNLAATAGTFTVTVDGQTTAGIAYDASAAAIKAAIEALSNVTTVTVVQLVASKSWTVEFIDTEALAPSQTKGFCPFSVSVAGLTTTTSVVVTPSFYTVKMTLEEAAMKFQPTHKQDAVMWINGNIMHSNSNRNINIAIAKNGTTAVVSPFTVRITTNNIPYAFGLVVYIDDIAKDDIYYLVACNVGNNNETSIVQDLTWYMQTR